jgi:hypothetical protein
MQWAISKSVDEIGERGEKLRVKSLEGYGDKTVIDGREERIGAGGRYGGVRLAVSNPKTQENNRAMLEAMFRRERRKRGWGGERGGESRRGGGDDGDDVEELG